jgi:hypothetical protein
MSFPDAIFSTLLESPVLDGGVFSIRVDPGVRLHICGIRVPLIYYSDPDAYYQDNFFSVCLNYGQKLSVPMWVLEAYAESVICGGKWKTYCIPDPFFPAPGGLIGQGCNVTITCCVSPFQLIYKLVSPRNAIQYLPRQEILGLQYTSTRCIAARTTSLGLSYLHFGMLIRTDVYPFGIRVSADGRPVFSWSPMLLQQGSQLLSCQHWTPIIRDLLRKTPTPLSEDVWNYVGHIVNGTSALNTIATSASVVVWIPAIMGATPMSGLPSAFNWSRSRGRAIIEFDRVMTADVCAATGNSMVYEGGQCCWQFCS